MKRRLPLAIAGEKIAAGETRDLHLKFSESYLGTSVSIPVRVIRAARSGPRVFLTGAIHGDELNGMGIIRELLYGEPPKLKQGTLICIPVVNIYGLDHHRRYMPDRRDLNRSFPGSEFGSPTSRLAYTIYNEIIKQCDCGIDFHSAAVRRTNYPNVRANMRKPAVRRLAQAFGCELIVDSDGPKGSLRRTAVASGIPTIMLEAGEVWKIEPGVVEVGLRGIRNVLQALGMVAVHRDTPLFQTVINETTWVRAQRGGILGFYVRPGELVRQGQPLAATHSIFGHERNTIISPLQGIVLGMTTMPAVKPGEPVYHIARIKTKELDAMRRKMNDLAAPNLYTRLQEELATNVTIQQLYGR